MSHVCTRARFLPFLSRRHGHTLRYDHGYDIPVHYLAKKIADENQVRWWRRGCMPLSLCTPLSRPAPDPVAAPPPSLECGGE